MALLKPVAWGFVIGSVVTMIVGFGWGGAEANHAPASACATQLLKVEAK